MAFVNVAGFGTTLYGSRDKNQVDGSYTATAWITLLYLPVIPLGSYRVVVQKQQGIGVGAYVKYDNVQKINLNTRQVINTYALWYISLLIVIAIPVIFFWWYGQQSVDQLSAALQPQY
jgi:hypothetical protein